MVLEPIGSITKHFETVGLGLHENLARVRVKNRVRARVRISVAFLLCR